MLVCIVGLHATALAAPFTNGSFEGGTWDTAAAAASGTDGGYGDWLNVNAGVPASVGLVAGWAPVAGQDFSWHVLPDTLTADGGTRVVDLNGDVPGGIEQTFDTVAGRTYRVDFAASRHFLSEDAMTFTATALEGGGGADLNSLGVTVPDTVGTSTALSTHWQDESFTFVASGASTTLRFVSSSATDGLGPMIDNVRVTDVTPVVAAPAPVPALGLWGLLGLSGLLGGLALRRSRRA
jgi:hypothetical protein